MDTANTNIIRKRRARNRPRERLGAIWDGAARVYRWMERKADEPMTGAGYALCGALLGLIFGPMIFYCYFG